MIPGLEEMYAAMKPFLDEIHEIQERRHVEKLTTTIVVGILSTYPWNPELESHDEYLVKRIADAVKIAEGIHIQVHRLLYYDPLEKKEVN